MKKYHQRGARRGKRVGVPLAESFLQRLGVRSGEAGHGFRSRMQPREWRDSVYPPTPPVMKTSPVAKDVHEQIAFVKFAPDWLKSRKVPEMKPAAR